MRKRWPQSKGGTENQNPLGLCWRLTGVPRGALQYKRGGNRPITRRLLICWLKQLPFCRLCESRLLYKAISIYALRSIPIQFDPPRSWEHTLGIYYSRSDRCWPSFFFLCSYFNPFSFSLCVCVPPTTTSSPPLSTIHLLILLSQVGQNIS